MTTPSSVHGVRGSFDTGPLSWVMAEIREALTRSNTAIQDAVAQDSDAQSTSLHHAKTYLHQAHGALQIIDVEGVALVTETVEDLLERLEAGKLAFTPELAQAIGAAYQAVTEYLEELLSGEPHRPLRLFPYYQALMEARGAEKIHPSDLFYPDLSIRPQLPLANATTEGKDYAVLRQRFEKALLPFLNSDPSHPAHASAQVMAEVINQVEQRQSNQQSRAFWWVLGGFAELAGAEKISNELYVKQLFARINIQIRRLSEGSTSIVERLLRDALFFIARADSPTPRTRQIAEAYQLLASVPADYDQKRYGLIDVEALANAKERLLRAKSIWNRIAGGDAGAAEAFEQEMKALAEAGSRLNCPSLSKLLRELNGIARHAAHSSPGDSIGLEIASSLLFVENALSHASRLSNDFSERADAMTARLLSIVSGEQPAESAQWLDEMSREAQQRQTMEALGAEMQSSLNQVEKTLEEFFSNPAKRSGLTDIDSVLHQISGALNILDQDQAVRAVEHIQAAVKGFAEAAPDAALAQRAFEQIAQNVGALSFFIESLRLNPDGIKDRYVFDEQLGLFRARPPEVNVSSPVFLTAERDLSGPSTETATNNATNQSYVAVDLPTVENELVEHQQQSAELALSLVAEPDNQSLHAQLKESLTRVRSDAALVQDPEANDRAQVAIDILDRPDFTASEVELAEIIAATAAPATTVKQIAAVVTPGSDEAVDAELLEIFLSEAVEVLECVQQTLPELRRDSRSQEHMTTLRRSFHTLKGSGRMVGLTAFGDAAWSVEQVLNLRLSEGQGGTPDLFSLIEKSVELLGTWVAQLQQDGNSRCTGGALIAAADGVKKGDAFYFDDAAEHASSLLDHEAGLSSEADDQPHVADADIAMSLPQVEEAQMSDADFAAFHLEAPAGTDDFALDLGATSGFEQAAPNQAAIAQVIEFPDVHPAEQKRDDNVKRIGALEISVPLHNIYLAETDELARLLSNDIAEWRHEPERDVNILAVHAAHSLAGSSATVGFTPLQEVAYALEMVLQALARKPVKLRLAEFDTLEQSIECLKSMLQQFALGEMPQHEPVHVRSLKRLQAEINARSGGESSAIQSSVPAFAAAEIDHAESSSAAIAPAERLPVSRDNSHEAIQLAVDMMPIAYSESGLDIEPAESLFERDASAERSLTPRDELDPDLLPVFLEEGNDILPQMGQLLRTWHQNPSDSAAAQSLLRLLHTIKGSARMAGAMTLGQHMHAIESRIEQITRLGAPSPDAIEDLLNRLDLGLYLFDQLQNPELDMLSPAMSQEQDQTAADVSPAQFDAPEPVRDEINSTSEAKAKASVPARVTSASFATAPLKPMPAADIAHLAPATLAASVPLVRVRADILDRMVNQAGEVSISRSRIETEVDTLRSSLHDMTENVSRLRTQLREIEIQAESQMSSQMAQSVDREFDPLEFDRFTRLQELTRMMAESVNDVASVQQNLIKTVDGATTDLSAQARLTRDLQQDLMRVRMVQFASISERLYRVTRQASKEVDKRVNLDIRGSSVEIDRSVLEKMAGPFEHLLRNAIVHGIESRAARVAAGKAETGELLVEIRQEGNEVVIQFSDDGQGLNLNRIREKAVTVGLLTNDAHVSDSELQDLIFHPGFSTAQEVTELAGRGVGMDVVRAEAAALGGRIAIHSEPGKGAHFLIQLPLTLAVTQVVLLATGGKTYAVPSVLVEQVQQLKATSLASAYNEGAVTWQSNRVPMYYLSALLGDTSATPLAQQYTPLIILKSGNDRVALHVDQVIGNREVVVKNIGPQLARMIGIAGATVLGSGNIVLILDPVPLAQRMLHENIRAPRLTPSDTPADMGAVAEMAASAPVKHKAEPVQGLRTQHIVMVVDDSLTVRRVTQRFLAREGYQIVLAKDGVDALEQLQSITPDVMLVDIEMPRMDGFDLTRNIRSDERTRHIPIIMITSRTATKHRNYAMELGVNEYLGKPYQESDLLKLVGSFVNKEAPVA